MDGPIVRQSRSEIVAWVGGRILPHEGRLRAWLHGAGVSGSDADDVVQEAYCRLAALNSVAHIANPRAYFFQTARSIVIERMRRSRIVRIDCLAEIEALDVTDEGPSPERIVAAQLELRRIRHLIEDLPDRCRQIFKLRRLRGLSQRQVAERLGVSEDVVEGQVTRGLRLILAAMTEDAGQAHAAGAGSHRNDQAQISKTDRR